MRKIILLFIILLWGGIVYCQQPFRYIIIPVEFSEIGKGLNPYQVSSNLQKILTEKGFNAVFEEGQRPADYCEALVVDLEKISSLLTNKLLVKFRDCQNNLIWSNEGVGRSKDFFAGYSEALADALDDFTEIPVNNKLVQSDRELSMSNLEEKGNSAAGRIASQSDAVLLSENSDSEEQTAFGAKELYFNDTYFVNWVDGGNGFKKIIVLNGGSLGYNKLQEIATLEYSDLPGLFTVEWTTPQGEILKGVAKLKDNKLNITLSSEGDPVVISLIKQ
jgi:hypothetical protein